MRAQRVQESAVQDGTRPSESQGAIGIEGQSRESSPEVVEVSALKIFSSTLKNAQRQASAAAGPTKRPRASQNQGTSDRTIRRNKKAKRDLEAQGFLSLPEFFKLKATTAWQQDAQSEPCEDNARGSTASRPVLVFEEEEEESDDEEDKGVDKRPMCMCRVNGIADIEEEEEDEDEGADNRLMHALQANNAANVEEDEEDEANTTGPDAHPTDRSMMSTPMLSAGEAGDHVFSCWGWGPSQTILCESKESLSSLGGSDTSLDDFEDLSSTDIKEVDGLREGNAHDDSAVQQPTGNAVDLLQDHTGLQRAHSELCSRVRAGGLDTVLHGCVEAMTRLLNLYLDKDLTFTWIKASEVVVKTEGHWGTHARSIRQRAMKFVHTRELPGHQHAQTRLSVLNDENVTHSIKEALGERAKNGFLLATDIVEVVSSPEIQAQLTQAGIYRPLIAKSTVCHWLSKLGWRHGRHQNGMYADGHEQEDVVKYRKGFVERFAQYEHHFTWDDEGKELMPPSGSTAIGHLPLILITHDKSTLYQNDQRQVYWGCPGKNVTPRPKGEGITLMVSNFLTSEWGTLHDNDREAQKIFQPGKNRDGWFTASHLLAQVDDAIDIFQRCTGGRVQGLFIFDNAPSHQKRADDALSARLMVKAPKKVWTHNNCGVRMRNGTLPNGQPQPLYYPNDHNSMPGWFKGMEAIIRERRLWPNKDLNVQCKDFKCAPDSVDCCSRRILFLQPDFIAQKSQLKERIESRSHICNFYPKYHCELNFIEQYWGVAKAKYRAAPWAKTVCDMETTVRNSLDSVPLAHIQR